MEADHPIKLRFAYTYQDWVRAYRLYFSQTRRSFIEKIAALIMAIIGYAAIALHYHPLFGFMFDNLWDFFITVFWFPAAVIMWFDLASIAGIWSRFHRKKPDSLIQEYEFTFDSKAARFQLGEETDVKLGWSGFERLLEGKETFVLILKDDRDGYWELPKRYFSDENELVRFRHLANNKPHESRK